jgi:hypothetical protein
MIRQDDTSQADGDINAAGTFPGVCGNGVVLRALRIAAWTWMVGLVMSTAVPAAERPDTGLPHDLEHSRCNDLHGMLRFFFIGAVAGL